MEPFENMTETERILKTNIRGLRKTKNLPSTVVIAGTNISQSYYAAIESRTIPKQISYEFLERIARFHGITVADLFREDLLDKYRLADPNFDQSLY